jgi:8-oxo-dGTP pyrophosphatase MutT (NUDIX family)
MRRLLHLALTMANRLRFAWWRIRKPHVYGAKVIVLDDDGQVLLIRHSYMRSHQWMLPGGGIGRGEDPVEAAIREVREEVGLVVKQIDLHGVFLDTSTGARNHIHIFIARGVAGMPRVDGVEIIAAQWFALDALPPTLASASRARIEEARDGITPASDRWL